MHCAACEKQGVRARVRVTNTYAVPGGQTQRAECPACNRVLVYVTLSLGSAEEHGQGAYALAQRLRAADEPPRVDLGGA